MVKRKPKSTITKTKLKKLFKRFKIRECKINLVRQTASGIFLSQISWWQNSKKGVKWQLILFLSLIITTENPASTAKNSAEGNDVLPPKGARRNVRRERAKSMYVERPLQFNNAGKEKTTMDDMHREFAEMYGRPNRGLRPCCDRQAPEAQPRPISECQKIFNEFKAKLAARKST